jgi:hypothetical protein
MDWRAFWRGFGSVLDLSGSSHREALPELPETDEEAFAMDQDAIASDSTNRPSEIFSDRLPVP